MTNFSNYGYLAKSNPIPGRFNTFKSNLEITDLQQSTVSGRQERVRDAVKAKMTVLNDFLTGSYSRSTMIAPLKQADVDIFLVLDPQYHSANGQAQLLDKVKGVLKETYPKTPDISRNGQAVTITFTDFVVDVVPGFYRNGGGYLIPSTYGGGRWIATNPKDHVQISSSRNAANNKMLVPMIKMIKAWNRNIHGYFRSFHLEVLAWEMFEFGGLSEYPTGLRTFFDRGRQAIRQVNQDPAGYDGDVGYYIANLDEASSRFETAYNRASKAVSYAGEGKYDSATEEWRKIFGDLFPAS